MTRKTKQNPDYLFLSEHISNVYIIPLSQSIYNSQLKPNTYFQHTSPELQLQPTVQGGPKSKLHIAYFFSESISNFYIIQIS